LTERLGLSGFLGLFKEVHGGGTVVVKGNAEIGHRRRLDFAFVSFVLKNFESLAGFQIQLRLLLLKGTGLAYYGSGGCLNRLLDDILALEIFGKVLARHFDDFSV
jgi:hypothetical protein